MVRKLLLLVGVLLLIAGLLIAFYPKLHQLQTDREIAAEVQSFYDIAEERPISSADTPHPSQSGTEPGAESDPYLGTEPVLTDMPFPELRMAMEAHNLYLYESGQASLSDPWSYQQQVFDLSQYGLEGEAVAVLRIDRLELELPVFLGATMDHMGRGAAQLSEIVLTNLWEELHYTVADIKIINPTDVDKILIQEGRDLLTLLTCHPYGTGGRYRLVVYCERTNN